MIPLQRTMNEAQALLFIINCMFVIRSTNCYLQLHIIICKKKVVQFAGAWYLRGVRSVVKVVKAVQNISNV